jgi:hypothetical protein
MREAQCILSAATLGVRIETLSSVTKIDYAAHIKHHLAEERG